VVVLEDLEVEQVLAHQTLLQAALVGQEETAFQAAAVLVQLVLVHLLKLAALVVQV
jgi:hypothetical protein